MSALMFEKKVIADLAKCYSLARLDYKGEEFILAATEKEGGCILVDKRGEIVDQVWSQPGGVMSLVPVPNGNGAFMATQKFYSPNDSAEACIVLVLPEENGWQVYTILELPHVHRFDILQANGNKYLIACTLKSGHKHKDDWSSPGKIYVAELPDDISLLAKGEQLKPKVIKDGLLKNHGYYRRRLDDYDTAVVSAEQGVFLITPPVADNHSSWTVEKLLSVPASDAVICDIDQDGQEEIVMFESFHGATMRVFHKLDNGAENGYVEVYSIENKLDFLHAIWIDSINGEPGIIIGHRKGTRDLFRLSYNHQSSKYQIQIIDENCGAANALVFQDGDIEYVAAANRETDQLCFYKVIN